MKSMCHDVRRNSPSVAARRPMSSCSATTSRIASSSTARRRAASIRPAAKSWRACTSARGRSRLPTWSARNGGSVRGYIGVQPSAPFTNSHQTAGRSPPPVDDGGAVDSCAG